jgi:hypothetical protein
MHPIQLPVFMKELVDKNQIALKSHNIFDEKIAQSNFQHILHIAH